MNRKPVILIVPILVVANLPALRAQQERPRLTFDQILQREDDDQDGKVPREEFRGPPPLFERLDRNEDGVLTKEDFDGQPNSPRERQSDRFRAPEDVEVLRNVVFGQGGGRDLTMHLVLPKKKPREPAPVYVWIHGGGWMGGTKEGGVRQVVPFVRKGFVGATIEYRLTGESPFPAQIEDCKCAIRYLRAHADKYNIDPQRIAVGGSSAGGHLVALLGTSGGVKDLEGDGGWADQSSSVQAVVDLYGPTDFQLFVTTVGYEEHNQDGSPESRLLGGGEVLPQSEAIRRVDPITYIDQDDPPFLIIHGSDDLTVPPNQSEALDAALKQCNVSSTLHIIEGAGHGGPEFSEPAIRAMMETFVLRNVAKKREPRRIPLWKDGAPGSEARMNEAETVEGKNVSNVHHPSITVYLPDAEKSTGTAVIIAPGGGHRVLCLGHEGDALAEWFTQRGIAAFVLRYRLCREANSTYTLIDHAMADTRRAIRMVRSRAEDWKINPARIGILGFSAGGELAAYSAMESDSGNPHASDRVEQMSSRPDFQGLIYPGKSDTFTVRQGMPPAFIAFGYNDRDDISFGMAKVYLQYKQAGVPCEMHVYANAGHGFGYRPGTTSAAGDWPQRFVEWLADSDLLSTDANKQ